MVNIIIRLAHWLLLIVVTSKVIFNGSAVFKSTTAILVHGGIVVHMLADWVYIGGSILVSEVHGISSAEIRQEETDTVSWHHCSPVCAFKPLVSLPDCVGDGI
jgi:hypothetical protein